MNIYVTLVFEQTTNAAPPASFQTTLTPHPEHLYSLCSVTKQTETVFECAFRMLSSSGADGLVTVHTYDKFTPTNIQLDS